ncbi:DNA integrity scanning protein DisA nucleotide-binding domain protein [Maridesulfovibrio ferrireducens]|uniref:DNA integrity scanning protein DisA nucleotide-binding domain protein n=1 Tax=Maridesulfovibrio ferrireducens TaxID=246191 RepID=UPI001A2A5554|nr:DNA integrity scanning protein DisA nucleotide-binding domain protein [Maridesulfovibrio ferrireducens]MBI9110348.1 DNA integrity scanning protein DisA nucleotide-binding domain protein [Maridesulfovibrio ferrireducens]
MSSESFANLCIFHIMDGLRDGLSHFSQISRTALLYAINPGDPLRIYDPQGLLRDHEPKLKEVYLDSDAWKAGSNHDDNTRLIEVIKSKDLALAGLITCGARSSSIFYQRWFTEQHPNMCSTGPTESWMEYAALMLSQDFAAQNILRLDSSGHLLREYSTHAVRDYIVDQRNRIMGWDTQLRVYPILDAILGISKTKEEGAWARGDLIFIEPSELDSLEYLAKFPENERPALKNHKHVRKLLQSVENSSRKLVSDGKCVVGISSCWPTNTSISADFKGEWGILQRGTEPVCSFADATFSSTNYRPNLVQLEENLLEIKLDANNRHDLFQLANKMVSSATHQSHGCTLVLDFNDTPVKIAGQTLEEPLDLRDPEIRGLARSLTKLDGAIHIGKDVKVYGFACLLDGKAVSGENRARGARFNSALRFTAKHPNIIVIVVSSDKPVSIIQRGVELTARCDWTQHFACVSTPPTLAEWIEG